MVKYILIFFSRFPILYINNKKLTIKPIPFLYNYIILIIVYQINFKIKNAETIATISTFSWKGGLMKINFTC